MVEELKAILLLVWEVVHRLQLQQKRRKICILALTVKYLERKQEAFQSRICMESCIQWVLMLTVNLDKMQLLAKPVRLTV